jgi:hypothetical protein
MDTVVWAMTWRHVLVIVGITTCLGGVMMAAEDGPGGCLGMLVAVIGFAGLVCLAACR